MLKNCIICGKEFNTNTTSKYCSNECREQGKHQRNLGMLPQRRCHDGGKPIWDYRCPSCREKWRKRVKAEGFTDTMDNIGGLHAVMLSRPFR